MKLADLLPADAVSDARLAALEVAGVVEGVVAAEDVDARLGAHPDEGVDDVVRHLAVADEGLSADQGEERGGGRGLLERAQPLEGILGEEAQAGLEGGPAEDVEAGEATPVEERGDRDEVTPAKTAEQEALLPMPQRRLHQFETGHEPRHCKDGTGRPVWRPDASQVFARFDG